MTWIKGENVYKDIELASKYGLDFLVWAFWIQKRFDENNLAMKYLQKMWIYRRGYFYSKYDEFFETNEKELIKEGDLMIKIQFELWKCIEEEGSSLKKNKNLVEISKQLEKGEYRGRKGLNEEMKKEFNEFLNEEKKKILEKEMNWEEEDLENEEKKERKEFYQVIIKGKKEFKSNSPFYLTKDRTGSEPEVQLKWSWLRQYSRDDHFKPVTLFKHSLTDYLKRLPIRTSSVSLFQPAPNGSYISLLKLFWLSIQEAKRKVMIQ